MIETGYTQPAPLSHQSNFAQIGSVAHLRNRSGYPHALITGEAESANELARREGLPGKNAARHLQMAYFAPDIIQAILGGDVTAECSYERLTEELPLVWNTQRQRFGFVHQELRSTLENSG